MSDDFRSGLRGQRRWYKTPLPAIIVALGVGASGVSTADAFEFGDGKRGWGAHHVRAVHDPAETEARLEKGIKHLAIEIDATVEQQAELIGLAKGAVEDLHAFGEMMRDDSKELSELLTGPTIDRDAIEGFRAERVDVIAQAGEVLSEEQRMKVAELIAKHEGKGRRWHGGPPKCHRRVASCCRGMNGISRQNSSRQIRNVYFTGSSGSAS